MNIEFHASPSTSLGVEMELELVDADSMALANVATELLGAIGAGHVDGEHPKAKHELLECTVEVITGVCATVGEARRDLAATLSELQPLADQRGLALLCSGTHPFSNWAEQTISPDPRYHRLVDEVQWPARRLQIFGIHVHVGVRSAEKAIAIANALTTYIPHFLAISASSPYWHGQDTGLASVRSKVFESLPTAGLPYQFADWAEFESFMTTLISARSITSIREVWWDIRPHPDFGTVELRICDGLPTLAEVAAVAALSQCLVEWLNARLDAGEPLPGRRGWIIRENKWRAARHGVDAQIIVDEQGTLVGLDAAIDDLVTELAPVADRLGCAAELEAVRAVAARPSYRRQREVVAGGGTLVDVVASMVQELLEDRPSPRPR